MNFWKNKSVLVTGANGFVGSWLSKKLLDEGCCLHALVSGHSNLGYLGRMNLLESKEIKIVRGDVRSKVGLRHLFKENSFDACFHLASSSIIAESIERPAETLEVNVKGTWNLLEAARHSNAKAIVVASTVRAYRESSAPLSEEDALFGLHPYDASKACADIVARSYAKSLGLQVAVTRCANTFGGNDLNYSRIIPYTIREVLFKKSPKIWGNGLIERDFLYVKDNVSAHLKLAEALYKKRFAGEAFNFGTGKNVSVKELVQKIISLGGNRKLKAVFSKKQERTEFRSQRIDTSKAKKLLHWKPSYTLEAGLKATIDWYREYYKQGLEKNLGKQQIGFH